MRGWSEGDSRDSRVDDIAEILTVDRWLARNAARLHVVFVDGPLASALPRITAGREPANPPKTP